MDSGNGIIPSSATHEELAEQKGGCLSRCLVIVGEQLSVTCLRVPSLLTHLASEFSQKEGHLYLL